MKNAFYFMLKAFFVLEIFAILPWPFAYIEKRFNKKATVSFKNYGVTDQTKNYCNTHITQYLKKWRQAGSATWSVKKI